MGRPPKNHVTKQEAFVDDAAETAELVGDDYVAMDTDNEAPVSVSEIKTGFVVFKLANTKRKGAVTIICIDDVFNPATKKIERVRVLRGIDSIWQKDQKDLDAAYIRMNQVWMRFEQKMCRVRESDDQLLQFARMTTNNIEAPNRRTGGLHEFFEWNPKRQAEAAAKALDKEIDAMTKAINLPLADVRKLALYLECLMTDAVGYPKTDEALRNDLVKKAKENPSGFLEALGDKMVNISYAIKKAVSEGKIDLGRSTNAIYWADGGLVTHYPQDRVAIEFLVEFASLPTNESQQFLKKLQIIST
jgi:hypothetical protein